jgi:hypothetical protein
MGYPRRTRRAVRWRDRDFGEEKAQVKLQIQILGMIGVIALAFMIAGCAQPKTQFACISEMQSERLVTQCADIDTWKAKAKEPDILP